MSLRTKLRFIFDMETPAPQTASDGDHPAFSDAADRIRLLWMPIDDVSFQEAVDRIVRLCRENGSAYVVTPNVDHFMRARRDEALRSIYENASLSLADGVPVVWASKFLGTPLKEKVSGSDLFVALCERAADEGLRVFLVGGDPGVAEQVKDLLRKRHPAIRIVGTASPIVDRVGGGPENDETIAMIRDARPQLLFVAFGCPKQERWIARHYRRLEGPVCIGVGASFDFAAGVQLRAPVWMQRAGLEWLWRLAHEPGRLWKRYLIDDLPFIWHVARQWIASRRDVSCGKHEL